MKIQPLLSVDVWEKRIIILNKKHYKCVLNYEPFKWTIPANRLNFDLGKKNRNHHYS